MSDLCKLVGETMTVFLAMEQVGDEWEAVSLHDVPEDATAATGPLDGPTKVVKLVVRVIKEYPYE